MVHVRETPTPFGCLYLCCLACVSRIHFLDHDQYVSNTRLDALSRGRPPGKPCSNQYVCSFFLPYRPPDAAHLFLPTPGRWGMRQTSSASPPSARAEAFECTHASLTHHHQGQSTRGEQAPGGNGTKIHVKT